MGVHKPLVLIISTYNFTQRITEATRTNVTYQTQVNIHMNSLPINIALHTRAV
jgi:hypothetical protein